MTETEDYDKSSTPTAHKTSHEYSGTDKISVDGLAGELADEQKSTWDKLTETPDAYPPEHHHGTHEAAGDDPVTRPDVLPAGGTAGQVLAKIDTENYNTEWIDAVVAALGLIPSLSYYEVLRVIVTLTNPIAVSVTIT